jgi:hypothetical protein
MCVIGHHLSLLAHNAKQDAFCGPTLMGRDDVLEAGQVLHHSLHPEKARAAGVRFISPHHRRPLLGGHRGSARVGEQIDQDVSRFEHKQVVARLAEESLALFAGSLAQGFDAFDAKRLDNSFHGSSCNQK